MNVERREPPWRIGHVEDHTLTALGMREILDREDDLHWVGTERSVEALLSAHGRLDVVVLDLWLGDDTTPEQNVAALAEAGIPALIYTTGEHPYLLRSAARAGAYGMVLKDSPTTTLIAAVRSVAQGEAVLPIEWAAAIDADPDLAAVRLSEQQAEILTSIASGNTLDAVARRLGISRETVKQHVERIRRKYAEAGRSAPAQADLTMRAVEDGLVPIRLRKRRQFR